MSASVMHRRALLRAVGVGAAAVSIPGFGWGAQKPARRPNILLAIADDQSWLSTSIAGCKYVHTPGFDRIAREGVLFPHAYAPAPQCSPARASLLTGRNIWQNEEAGTHGSLFPGKLKVYTDLLEAAGYLVGYTGKPWSPGNWKDGGRTENPSGKPYMKRKLEPPAKGIAQLDYTANFQDFLNDRQPDQPFCFWYGCYEPHRGYEEGSGLKAGKTLDSVKVPGFLPDSEVIRSDLLDYGREIDWFDLHLGKMIAILRERGELDNTLIVVTADNGMPFPRAKADLHEFGTRVPMAIRWGDKVPGGRVVEDFMSFIDLGPTFLDAAGLTPPPEMTGRSLLPILVSGKVGWVDPKRDCVLTGRERHTHARPDNLGYPARAIRTREYLYIRNFKPDRWPMGDGYADTDQGPSKGYVVGNKDKAEVKPFFEMAFAKRPLEQLYDMQADPNCLRNLADVAAHAKVKAELWGRLEKALREQGDPRVLGYGDIFDSYPRFMYMRKYPGFKEQGKYNPEYQKKAQEAMKSLGLPSDD